MGVQLVVSFPRFYHCLQVISVNLMFFSLLFKRHAFMYKTLFPNTGVNSRNSEQFVDVRIQVAPDSLLSKNSYKPETERIVCGDETRMFPDLCVRYI